MTVSIVVPVYNVENYIEKCVDSIIQQSFKNIEIILVDDGSTDRSGDICERLKRKDSRIVVLHKKNGGLSDARNMGIDYAKGEWITFVDSDDYVSDNYVQYLMELNQKYGTDISIASYTYISNNKSIDHSNGEEVKMEPQEAIRRMLLDDGFDMGAWSKMYRTKFFKQIHFPVGKLFEDSFTTYQIFAEANSISFGSKSIYYYVNRFNSTVNGSFNEKKFDLIEMNKKTELFIKNKFPEIAPEAHRRVIWAYFSTLNQVIMSHNLKVVEKYAGTLVEYILGEKNFILKEKFVPKRDKLGYLALKAFGLKGYTKVWNTYLKIIK